ncbi:MAG: fatty acid desaturase [Verrucomicrobia bacterium]|nr:fatty acid desaturase [Verrucomicrobiota bacterium]MDA1067420.1 fatty acid desaturase [Verrucomicrobiota bacterium]
MLRLFYYTVIVGVSIWFGFWKELLVLWIIPLLIVLPAIVRFSAICEHKYDIASGKIEESTATIIPFWWERLLFPRLHFNYHIYHHYYPGVAFTHLPEVHRIFQKEGLVDESNIFRGYHAYFKHLLER